MKLNNLNLNMLKCFQAVAEKGSLQQGARGLHLTTSAVYQSVKKLEEELGQHLFFRTGNNYVLTENGKALQELFQRFLWDFSQFQEKSEAKGPLLEGVIRVGMPLNFSKAFFVPLLKHFHAEHPGVVFHVTVAETRRLVAQVCAFELDFAITDDAIPAELAAKVARRPVYSEELSLVGSREFCKAHAKTLQSIKSIKTLPHLDYARDLPVLQRWYKLHYQRQVKLTGAHIIDNVETMLAALKAGLGLGVIPRSLLAANEGELQEISFKAKSLRNDLFLVQESNYINSTLMKRFLQFLKDASPSGRR